MWFLVLKQSFSQSICQQNKFNVQELFEDNSSYSVCIILAFNFKFKVKEFSQITKKKKVFIKIKIIVTNIIIIMTIKQSLKWETFKIQVIDKKSLDFLFSREATHGCC